MAEVDFVGKTQLLQMIRKRAVKNYSIVKILKEPAVGKMENFLSELSRVTITTMDENGCCKDFSVIHKKITQENSLIPGFLSQAECFKTEITVYANILGDINKLMKDNFVESNLLWPKCLLYSRKENTLVLEDLKPKGYQMVDKKFGLNEKEAFLAVNSMAKIHAWSKLLMLSGKTYEKLGQFPAYTRKLKFFENYYSSGLKTLITYLESEERVHENWSSVVEGLKKIDSNFQMELESLAIITKGVYDVFNMGDCWANNILVKRKNGVTTGIKFIDFQTSYVNSFSWDLTYLLYMNVFPEVRLKRYDVLLDEYRNSFLGTLGSAGCAQPDDVAPSDGLILREMDRLLLPAFLFILSHLELSSVGEDQDHVQVLGEFKQTWFRDNWERVKADLEFFKEKGLL